MGHSQGQAIYDQVLVALRRITRATDLHSKQLALHYGLTGPQLILLQEVVRRREVSTGELAKRVNLSHATVTDILHRLEKGGFVQRVRSSSDRRRVLVEPTDSGCQMLQRTPSLLKESFIAELRELQDWEQTLILSALQRVACMMEAEDNCEHEVLTDEVSSETVDDMGQTAQTASDSCTVSLTS